MPRVSLAPRALEEGAADVTYRRSVAGVCEGEGQVEPRVERRRALTPEL